MQVKLYSLLNVENPQYYVFTGINSAVTFSDYNIFLGNVAMAFKFNHKGYIATQKALVKEFSKYCLIEHTIELDNVDENFVFTNYQYLIEDFCEFKIIKTEVILNQDELINTLRKSLRQNLFDYYQKSYHMYRVFNLNKIPFNKLKDYQTAEIIKVDKKHHHLIKETFGAIKVVKDNWSSYMLITNSEDLNLLRLMIDEREYRTLSMQPLIKSLTKNKLIDIR